MNGLVVIPAYNERVDLPRVLAELTQHVPAANVLVIDDGSSDGTDDVLATCGVPYLRHPLNLGYQNAMITGIRYAHDKRFDFVVFFDADGQHRTQDLKKVIGAYEDEGYDLIIGSRFLHGRKEPLTMRVFGNQVFATFARAFFGVRMTDPTCGLKLISRKYMLPTISIPAEDFHAELIVNLVRLGARMHEVGITVEPRVAGSSMYHLSKAILYPAKTLVCMLAGLIAPQAAAEVQAAAPPADSET